MSEPAPAAPALLSHSQSFSGSNSRADLASTFVKRRFASSSTLELFAPAAKSFHPLPYTPHGVFNTSNTQSRTFTTRHSRPHDALAPPGMDPMPTDPNVVFIHPPFATFPNSEQHPDGLCYQTLASNPEWFLDPNDFTHETNTNPHAIPYPPILEPPRGWCPARKKDLKERGAEGWPEGEEPRLRCTFCRRTYAGVNAKSMWRRHVFEKHKIAMANRRDGTDKPRGRGTGKENKTSVANSKPKEEPLDKLVRLEVAPQVNPQADADATPHQSIFRFPSASCDNSKSKRDRKKAVFVAPKNPGSSQPEASGSGTSSMESEPELADAPAPEHTPPHSPLLQAQLIDDHFPVLTTPGPSLAVHVPPSPYDPLLQPSFRHSPPPLPSDHPWRFPSPSHPLHSQARDIPLTMLAPSPLFKIPIPPGTSPQSSPFSTPSASRSSDLKTPSTLGFSLKSGSRPWFFKNHLSSPLDQHSKSKSRPGSSPLSSSLRGTPVGHKRNISALPDDWLTDNVLGPDPFAALYSPFPPPLSADSSPRKSIRSMGDVSPVLRAGTLPVDLGLGLGLLKPFSLSKESSALDDIEDIDAELEGMDKAEFGKAAGPSTALSPRDVSSCLGPPQKKRRLSSP